MAVVGDEQVALVVLAYLRANSGRFPETLAAFEREGRAALGGLDPGTPVRGLHDILDEHARRAERDEARAAYVASLGGGRLARAVEGICGVVEDYEAARSAPSPELGPAAASSSAWAAELQQQQRRDQLQHHQPQHLQPPHAGSKRGRAPRSPRKPAAPRRHGPADGTPLPQPRSRLAPLDARDASMPPHPALPMAAAASSSSSSSLSAMPVAAMPPPPRDEFDLFSAMLETGFAETVAESINRNKGLTSLLDEGSRIPQTSVVDSVLLDVERDDAARACLDDMAWTLAAKRQRPSKDAPDES